MSTIASDSRKTSRSRPQLFTTYASEMAIFNTRVKKFWIFFAVLGVLIIPFLVQRDMVALITTVFIYAIGGIGLNLLTGFAGQVSLGHAFFLGIGAYTGAVLGGESRGNVIGLGWDMAIWLPLAGLVPAVIALIIAPLAARVRGLYLAILTLGLVFIGEHIFKEATPITGGAGVGRAPAEPVLFGFNLFANQEIFGVKLDRFSVYYFGVFVIFVVMALAARNFTRSRFGRSFAAVRDRDIAAEVMGISLLKMKSLAFAVSAFYAGIAGALLSVVIGRISPETWNIFLSIDFLAVIFIGGLASITGTIFGAIFVVMLPKLVNTLTGYLPIDSGVGQGALLNVFEIQSIIFGLLIILFVILEPRGLYGLWIRLRNYFKAWPFSF
jgi:branched-chain amino acid transport system permease protein